MTKEKKFNGRIAILDGPSIEELFLCARLAHEKRNTKISLSYLSKDVKQPDVDAYAYVRVLSIKNYSIASLTYDEKEKLPKWSEDGDGWILDFEINSNLLTGPQTHKNLPIPNKRTRNNKVCVRAHYNTRVRKGWLNEEFLYNDYLPSNNPTKPFAI